MPDFDPVEGKTLQTDKSVFDRYIAEILEQDRLSDIAEKSIEILQSEIEFDWAGVFSLDARTGTIVLVAQSAALASFGEVGSRFQVSRRTLDALSPVTPRETLIAEQIDLKDFPANTLEYGLLQEGFEEVGITAAFQQGFPTVYIVDARTGRKSAPETEMPGMLAATCFAVGRRQVELKDREIRSRTITQTIYDISVGIKSGLPFKAIVEMAMAGIQTYTQADGVNVILRNQDDNKVVGYRGYAHSPEAVQAFANGEINLSNSIWKRLQTRKILHYPVVEAAGDWMNLSGFLWIRAWAALPIWNGIEVVGVINIDSRWPNVFDPEELELLTVISGQLSEALLGLSATLASRSEVVVLEAANAQLDFQARLERLISEISYKFLSVTLADPEEGILEALELMGKFLGASIGVVMLNDQKGDWGLKATQYIWKAEDRLELPEELARYDYSWVLNQMIVQEVICIDGPGRMDASEPIERLLRNGTIDSLIIIPFIIYGTQIGIIQLVNVQEVKVWQDEMLMLLRLYAEVIGNALSHAENERQIRSLANFERMTTEISTKFISSPLGQIQTTIEQALSQIGMLSQANPIFVYRFEDGGRKALKVASWLNEMETRQAQLPDVLDLQDSAWFLEKVFEGKTFLLPHLDELVTDTTEFGRLIIDNQLENLAIAPMVVVGKIYGFIGFSRSKDLPSWEHNQASHLTVFAEVIASFLHRERSFQENRRLISVINNLPIGIVAINENRIIEYANQAFSRLGDLTAKEVEGTEIFQIVGTETAVGRNLIEQLEEDAANRREFSIKTSDGQSIMVGMLVLPLFDKKSEQHLHVIVLDDVTSSRMYEQRFQSLFETAPEAIIILDYETSRIIDSNLQAQQMFEIGPEEINQYTPIDLSPEIQSNGMPSKHLGPEYFRLAKEGLYQFFEWTHRSTSGREYFCEIHLYAFEHFDTRYLRASIIDITRKKELERQYRESSEMVNAFSRDLHDSVVQTLFSLGLRVESVKMMLREEPDKVIPELDTIGQLGKAAMAELRTMLFQMRPKTVHAKGLVPVLQEMILAIESRENISINLEVHGEKGVFGEQAITLFRIAQEALNNVVKHASVKEVDMELTTDEYSVTLVVEDKGKGFTLDGPQGRSGMGLNIMQERIDLLDGTLNIISVPGGGTKIMAVLPLIGDDEQDAGY